MGRQGKKRPTVEEEIHVVAALSSVPIGPAEADRLREALASDRSLVAARAARIVKERHVEGLGAPLVSAFERFLRNPVKSDPGCNAKLAALEALDFTDHTDPDPYLAACRHVQLEPAWGPPVDTAAPLRARGVLALAHIGHPDVVLVASELLTDPQPPVRQAAAEALAHCGDRAAAGPLLVALPRKDEEPAVTLAILSGLLALAPDHAMARLRALLTGKDELLRELAAIALGQSGRDDAATVLLDQLEESPLADERALILRALGFHRSDRALDALLEVIAAGPTKDAVAAVAALGVRRFEPRVRERAREAAARNTGTDLTRALAEAFREDDV